MLKVREVNNRAKADANREQLLHVALGYTHAVVPAVSVEERSGRAERARAHRTSKQSRYHTGSRTPRASSRAASCARVDSGASRHGSGSMSAAVPRVMVTARGALASLPAAGKSSMVLGSGLRGSLHGAKDTRHSTSPLPSGTNLHALLRDRTHVVCVCATPVERSQRT